MMLYKFTAIISLFAHVVLGVDMGQHCPEDQLCLTSFKQCDDSYDEGCRELPGSYPWMSDNSVQLPALLGGTNYTISWVFGPRGQADVPVRIEWQMNFKVWETCEHSNITSRFDLILYLSSSSCRYDGIRV